MPDLKISQLTAKGTAIASTDLIEISQSDGAGGYVTKSVTGANIIGSKQDTLISGSNIKTVNSTTLLGSGDLTVQPTLVSGTNIKTINSNSILGSGDLVITGGVSSVSATTPVVATGTTTPVISLASSYGDTQNPYASKTANNILAAPNGTAGVPTFRAIVGADIPTLNQNTTGTSGNVTGIVAVANGGTGTATPSLVAGTGVTITGTFPNQTINSSGGGSTSPAGSNTQIQYNNSGVFGASSKFSWSNANEGLSIISESGAGTRGLALHQHQTGPQAAAANFLKSRGTSASPTAVITGDIIGIFNFRPYIGTTYGQDQCLFGASMTSTTGVSQFFIAGTTGSNYTPNLLIAENGNVTVGNLGTGTIITSLTLPTSKLQVAGNAAIGFTTATAAPTNGLSVSGTVNIGTNTSVTTAALQVSSTTQGFLPPVMTTTQRIAIITPAAGLIVYDTTDNKHYGYNGTTWNAFY